MPFPADLLQASRHTDPSPFYAHWCATRAPLAFDHALGLWIASGPAVPEALAHPGLHVRPPSEPVPRALLGTMAGEVFAQLVRMNDGAFHARHRPEVDQAISRWNRQDVEVAAAAATRNLAGRVDANALLWQIPVQAMVRLLDVPDPQRDATVQWVHDFTQAIGPGADAAAVTRGDAAARALMAQGAAEGLDPVRAANRIALMQQSLDATAGLLGNAVVRWRRERAVPGDAFAFLLDVARADPAIHNTRRFAAADVDLAGQRLRTGDAVLVLLATAGLGFGWGRHACPGEAIAIAIAATALRELAGMPGWLDRLPPHAGYRPLPNCRIPVFS